MTAIPDDLVTYLTARERERSEHVAALLDALTDRERHIVKDAAIAGHALGVQHGRREPLPDPEIVAMVTATSPSIPIDPTPRERFLLHDAAVMGFVRGGINGAGGATVSSSNMSWRAASRCRTCTRCWPGTRGS